MARRKEEVDIDGLLELDNKRRELLFDVEQKKAQQNVVSKQIPQFKKEGKDTTEIFAQMKELSDSIKADDEKVRELDEKIQTIMYTIPNILMRLFLTETPMRTMLKSESLWSRRSLILSQKLTGI